MYVYIINMISNRILIREKGINEIQDRKYNIFFILKSCL